MKFYKIYKVLCQIKHKFKNIYINLLCTQKNLHTLLEWVNNADEIFYRGILRKKSMKLKVKNSEIKLYARSEEICHGNVGTQESGKNK